MVLLSIFFTNQIHGGIIKLSLFILSLHALAYLAVKILLQIFLYEDCDVNLTYICQLYFSECQQDRTLLRNQNILSENDPNIWHKSSTKPEEGQTRLKR